MQLPLKDTLRPDEHDLFIITIFYIYHYFLWSLYLICYVYPFDDWTRDIKKYLWTISLKF